MKGLSFKQSRPPETVKETEMFQVLMAEANAVYLAFGLNCDMPVAEWVRDNIHPSTLEQFMTEIQGCNRVVAFIRFIQDGAYVDITFCNGSKRVYNLAVMYDGLTDKLRVP